MGLSNNLSCEAGSFSCCCPIPMGVFTQRFEALFPRAGALGCTVCFAPAFCPAYLCVNVGLRGATRCSACPVVCHSESGPLSLSVCECRAAGSACGQTACPVCPTLQCESSPPRLPISTPPTGLDECFFFISLVSDFLGVRFSVSSGCARRRSVSAYAAILVLLSPI